MRRFFILIVFLMTLLSVKAQDERSDTLLISATLQQSVSSGEHSPFWLTANKQGLSSIDKGFGFFEVSAIKKIDDDKRFSWGAGVDLAVPWKFTSQFVIQQLYAEAKYRCLDLSIGSRNYRSEIRDSELSSGSLVFSGNARPVPQVRLGIFEYEPLKFTKDWVSIKGYLSYGKFTDSSWQEHWAAPGSRYETGALLCSRGFWLKGGDEKRFPLVFEFGLDMATQFSGTIYNLEWYNAGGESHTLKMPSGIKAWLKGLIPLSGDKGTIDTEYNNIEGNTIGAWDFSLSWNPAADWKVKAYWQHMFEDHSMMLVQYPWKDGLWGVQGWLPENPFLSSVVFEFLYSKYQSGPVYNDTCQEVPEQVSGVDNYYNHELYPGWMHWGMGIGNPFSISPIYNADHILTFYANRNISYHVGLKGSPMAGLNWRVLLSNTRSWGNYYEPYPEVRKMWNFLAEVKWRPAKMRNLECQASVAFDRGDLVGNNFGVMVGVRYDIPVLMRLD